MLLSARRGEKQLDLLSLRFRNEHLDAIYSSPLIRAYRTAEAVNKFHGLPIQKGGGPAGNRRGGHGEHAPVRHRAEVPELAYNWDHAPDLCRFPHGETMEEAYRRVNRAIDRIIAENPGKTVAVTTHGGVIKNLNARVEFGNIQGLRQGKVFGNTSVSVLEAEDGRPSLEVRQRHVPICRKNCAAPLCSIPFTRRHYDYPGHRFGQSPHRRGHLR